MFAKGQSESQKVEKSKSLNVEVLKCLWVIVFVIFISA